MKAIEFIKNIHVRTHEGMLELVDLGTKSVNLSHIQFYLIKTSEIIVTARTRCGSIHKSCKFENEFNTDLTKVIISS